MSQGSERANAAGFSPAPGKRRNQTLDGLKYVAAAAIVLHHVALVETGGRLGQFIYYAAATALFFFFAVSGYLHGAVGGRGRAWRVKRLARLGIPYAAWSIFYLLWGQTQILQGKGPFLPNPFAVVFLGGANGILWFLPVLLVCAELSDLVILGQRSRRVAIAACLVVTLVLYWTGLATALQIPWSNFVLAPRFLMIYLLGMGVRAWGPLRVSSVWVTCVAMLSFVGAGVMGMLAGKLGVPLDLTIATIFWTTGTLAVLAGAASGMRWFGAARLSWGKDYLLGVYLSHVLWLSLFVLAVPPSSMHPAIWIPFAWAACFAAASATTWMLLSIPLTRPVVT